MTNQEFLGQFNILYNNVFSNAAPGLDEYEISVILTKAQDEILKSHLTALGNKYRQGVDDSHKRQADFNMLVSETLLTPSELTIGGVSKLVFTMPEDIFSVLTEKLILGTMQEDTFLQKTDRIIIPLSHEEYQRIWAKPYHEPLKRQAWKLIVGQTGQQAYVETVISTADKDYVQRYALRYIRKPRPIILCDLSTIGSGLTIGGKTEESSCELDTILHEEILQRAVEIAKSAYGSDTNGQLQLQNQITMGQRSE